MTSGEANDSDLAEGIVGTNSYEAEVPAKKEFLPWHRPRKQFVRQKQWAEQIAKLLDQPSHDRKILKYLGLPGVDLLDIRYIHEAICEPRNLGLQFLGFNTAANPKNIQQAELNISLDEVSKLSNVDPASEVIPDDFRQLSNSASMAWKKALALGPYDVVNLDLCDGFAGDGVSQINNTYYNAVAQLLSLQSRSKSPWLLLLTTRVGKEHVHPEALKIFLERYLANLNACAEFKEESSKHFLIDGKDALFAAAETNAGLQNVFLIGLCKWLLGLTQKQVPPTSIEVKSVLGYRVEKAAGILDLASIAILFTPSFAPVADPTRLARATVDAPDECSVAVKVLSRVRKIRDVDSVLSSDAKLLQEMTDAMGRLLEAARYDIADYTNWLATNP